MKKHVFGRILVLAPHTDDGEFGCGGTIARFVEEGAELHYAAFSIAEKSVPEGLPKDILATEVKIATEALGIPEKNLIIYKYEVREFPQQRQEILEDLIKLSKEINPTAVFLPSRYDTHQDHQVISNEGFRAFKKTTLFGYEIPWNNLTFDTQSFITFSERHLQKKIEAIKAYASQSRRNYGNEDFVRNLACVRGVQISAQYAEAFEVMRFVYDERS